MAGTTGLEPGTSDVTGKGPLRGVREMSLHFQFVSRVGMIRFGTCYSSRQPLYASFSIQ